MHWLQVFGANFVYSIDYFSIVRPKGSNIRKVAHNLACDWFGAGLALLGVQAAKALEAVRAVVSGGEVLTGQLCLTVSAHKTLLVPRLVPIGHTAFSQGLETKQAKGACSFLCHARSSSVTTLECDSTDLFTACAPWSKLVLIAGHAVVLVLVRDEGLGADRLFAAVTDEAALVPCGACVLQFPRTCFGEIFYGFKCFCNFGESDGAGNACTEENVCFAAFYLCFGAPNATFVSKAQTSHFQRGKTDTQNGQHGYVHDTAVFCTAESRGSPWIRYVSSDHSWHIYWFYKLTPMSMYYHPHGKERSSSEHTTLLTVKIMGNVDATICSFMRADQVAGITD